MNLPEERIENNIFSTRVGLNRAWLVNDTKVGPAAKQLNLFLDFERGTSFPRGV